MFGRRTYIIVWSHRGVKHDMLNMMVVFLLGLDARCCGGDSGGAGERRQERAGGLHSKVDVYGGTRH